MAPSEGKAPGASSSASEPATDPAPASEPARDSVPAEAPARRRPKQPEVLVTTATTGEGIPALLASLDRHRAAGREDSTSAARLARAEAQVWAILADRTRAELDAPDLRAETAAILKAVADYELDPFAAVDRLLEGFRR
jgi:putative protein kinase ArgK-like GTPase of G3E family